MSCLLYKQSDHDNDYNTWARENFTSTDTGIRNFKIYKNEAVKPESENYRKLYNDAVFSNVNPRDLAILPDKVKDKINLEDTPENEREGVWFYYNGIIYDLKNLDDQDFWANHPYLLNAVIKNIKLRNRLKAFRAESYLPINEKKIKNVGALAFGHRCAGNVAIIDLNAISSRVNSEIVKNALQQHGYNKVYIGDLVERDNFPDILKLQRIAKRLMYKI